MNSETARMLLPAHPQRRAAGNAYGCVTGLACAALAWLALALTSPARADDAPPGTPGDTPRASVQTHVAVHNATGATLHGFRVRGANHQWTTIGDLPPGDSGFDVAMPRGYALGSFEFQYPRQVARGAYTIGGFRPGVDGQARIELDAGGGSVGSLAIDTGLGSVLLSPGAQAPAGDAPAELRTPLLEVPAERAVGSHWMMCSAVTPIAGILACGDLVDMAYVGLGAGLGTGFSVGYFWAQQSDQDLARLFPIHANNTHVGVVEYIDFFTLSNEHHPSLNIGKFVGIGPGIGTLFAVTGAMHLLSDPNAAPAGSYTRSCSDIQYLPDAELLGARCSASSGAVVQSRLEVASCFGGEVANVDGVLQCDRPPGSYQNSCSPIRMLDGMLQASCTRADGTQAAASLDVAHDCASGSAVSNIDGALHCDSPWLPPGPYRDSCTHVRFQDGVLQADCGGALATRSLDLRLDYRKACREASMVDFVALYGRRGYLSCRDAR